MVSPGLVILPTSSRVSVVPPRAKWSKRVTRLGTLVGARPSAGTARARRRASAARAVPSPARTRGGVSHPAANRTEPAMPMGSVLNVMTPMEAPSRFVRTYLVGIPKKGIAAQLGFDVKTVRRYLAVARARGVEASHGPPPRSTRIWSRRWWPPRSRRPASLGATAGRRARRTVSSSPATSGTGCGSARSLLRRRGVEVGYGTLRRSRWRTSGSAAGTHRTGGRRRAWQGTPEAGRRRTRTGEMQGPARARATRSYVLALFRQ